MPASFQEILNSRLYRVIVGEKVDGISTEFEVHEKAISQLSPTVRDIVQGKPRYLIREYISKGTFERLVQFAYTGDYSIPEAAKRLKIQKVDEKKVITPWGMTWDSNHNNVPLHAPEPNPMDDLSSYKPKKDKKKSKKVRAVVEDEPPWLESREDCPPSPPFEPSVPLEKTSPEPPPVEPAANFYSLEYTPSAPRNNYHDTCEPAAEFDPDQSYSNILIAHAQLYAVGTEWKIKTLKALVLHKLHKTLCVFKLDEDHTQDIVDLARFVNTEEGMDGHTELGEIRGLVSEYISQHKCIMATNIEFMELLGQGGKLVKDFFLVDLKRT